MDGSEGVDKGKQLFWQFGGDTFQMFREGVFDEYKKYNVSKATESVWLREYLNERLEVINNTSDFEIFLVNYNVTVKLAVQLGDVLLFKKLRDDTKNLPRKIPEFYILVIMEQLFENCIKFQSEIKPTAEVVLNVINEILLNPIENDYRFMLASGREMKVSVEEIKNRYYKLLKKCNAVINEKANT